MKKNILFGTLVFFLSMFMVACGKKRAATPSGTTITVPSQPGIAVGTDGQLSNVCSQSSCRFYGTTSVTNPDVFGQLGNGELFSQSNSNDGFSFDFGDSFGDQLSDLGDTLEENCGLDISIGFGGGDRGLNAGFGCDFTDGGRPQVISNYETFITTSASLVSITLKVPLGNSEFARLDFRGNADGSGRFFDSRLGVIITPLPAGAVVNGFVLQRVISNQPVEMAIVRIGGNAQQF